MQNKESDVLCHVIHLPNRFHPRMLCEIHIKLLITHYSVQKGIPELLLYENLQTLSNMYMNT